MGVVVAKFSCDISITMKAFAGKWNSFVMVHVLVPMDTRLEKRFFA